MYKYTEDGHAHTLRGLPLMGTSTVVNVIAKPLTWWASGLAVMELGWLNPNKFTKEECASALLEGWNRVRELTMDAYAKLLDKAYRAHSKNLKKTAKAGTDLHAELERFVKNTMQGIDGIYDPKIQPFIDWSKTNVKRFIWSEIYCYSEELWCGGISDCGIEDMEGRIAVIDFKSSTDAYASQFFQCAGYAIELQENGGWTAEGEQVFGPLEKVDYVLVVPFGAKIVAPVPYYDMENAKTAFKAAVTLHKSLLPFNKD